MRTRHKNVIPLRVVNEPEEDMTFFNKLAVSVGTRFRYCGATGRSEWIVDDIVTLVRDHGHHREDHINHVRVGTDVVHLRRLHTKKTETRRATFVYLRYSAIWRVD